MRRNRRKIFGKGKQFFFEEKVKEANIWRRKGFFEEMKNGEGKRGKYLEIKTLFFEVKEREKNILRRKKL